MHDNYEKTFANIHGVADQIFDQISADKAHPAQDQNLRGAVCSTRVSSVLKKVQA